MNCVVINACRSKRGIWRKKGKIFQHKTQARGHIAVAVRWGFFYQPTRRIPTSLFNPSDEMGKLGARSSTSGA